MDISKWLANEKASWRAFRSPFLSLEAKLDTLKRMDERHLEVLQPKWLEIRKECEKSVGL